MNYLTKLYVMLITFVGGLRDRKGQTLVEYALILVLIAIAVMVAMRFLATSTGNVYNKVGVTLGQ